MLYIEYRNAFGVLGPNVFHNKLGPCEFVHLIRLFMISLFMNLRFLLVLMLVCGLGRRIQGLSLDLWLIRFII
jgi:hypothetical protein